MNFTTALTLVAWTNLSSDWIHISKVIKHRGLKVLTLLSLGINLVMNWFSVHHLVAVWLKISFFSVQVSASSVSPLVLRTWPIFSTSTPSVSCSWASTCRPANKPWLLATRGDAYTCGPTLQRFPSTTTRGRPSSPCRASSTLFLSLTGTMTCYPSRLSPCRWRAASRCCLTGLPHLQHPAPGNTPTVCSFGLIPVEDDELRGITVRRVCFG